MDRSRGSHFGCSHSSRSRDSRPCSTIEARSLYHSSPPLARSLTAQPQQARRRLGLRNSVSLSVPATKLAALRSLVPPSVLPQLTTAPFQLDLVGVRNVGLGVRATSSPSSVAWPGAPTTTSLLLPGARRRSQATFYHAAPTTNRQAAMRMKVVQQ